MTFRASTAARTAARAAATGRTRALAGLAALAVLAGLAVGAAETPKRTAISLEDAKAIVVQAYGGRIVSATEHTRRPPPDPLRKNAVPPKGERGYRVRVDVDGRVKTLFVDRRGRIHPEDR